MNGRARRRAPVEQLQRQPEIGVDDEVAIGRRGVGDGAQMDDGVELAAIEPGEQLGRRHDIGELALAEVAPFALAPRTSLTTMSVRPASLRLGDQIRSDEPGPAGDQQHPSPRCRSLPLPQRDRHATCAMPDGSAIPAAP